MIKQRSSRASPCGWRTHTRYLEMHTRKRHEMVHITDEVERIVREIGEWLEKLAPAKPD